MNNRPFPAYKGDEPYVFVSYAHADSAKVYPLLVDLRDRGVKIWYDEGIEPGSKWREELSTAIQNAEKVLYIASAKSIDSPNCEREIDYALSLNVPVRVVYIENVTLPPALSFSLGSHQAVFADHYDDETFRQKVHETLIGNPEKLFGIISPRKSRQLGIGVLAAVTLAAALVYFGAQTGTSDPATERAAIDITPTLEAPVRIAVKPLQNVSGDDGLDWVGDGLANLLRDQLSSSRYAVVLSPVSWLSLAEGVDTDAELMAKASDAGIDYFVSGELLGSDDDLLATVRVTNLRAGIDVMSQTYPELSETELVSSSTRIAVNIKQAMKIPREKELQSLSADFVTKNITAYEAYIDGLQHYNRFEYEEAEKSMTTALSLAPDFYIARYRLADILNTTSRRNSAQDVFAEIPADAGLNPRERLYIEAFRHVLAGASDEAINVYDEILAEYPYEIEAQQLLARAYFDTYQEQKAIDVLTQLKLQEPENPHVLGALGYQLTSIGKLDEADAVLQEYIRLYPDVPNAWELAGSLKLRRAEIAAAQSDFTKALELDPAFTAARIGLANAQAVEWKLDVAAQGFTGIRNDATLPPRHRIDAAFNLVYVLRASGKPGEIEAALAPVLELIRNEGVRTGLYWYVLAEGAYDLGETARAYEYLTNGMRDNPAGGVPTRFLHLRGVINAQTGASIDEETVELAEYKLPDDNPDRTEDKAISHLQGLAALKADNIKQAEGFLQKAVEQFGYEYGIYQIELAEALFLSGKRREAINVIEEARTSNDSLLSGELRLDLLWHRHRAAYIAAEFYDETAQPEKAARVRQTMYQGAK